jgi:hypothetical protein
VPSQSLALGLYGTDRATNGAIDLEDIPPGDYILAFNDEFSGLSRKQVTAFKVFGCMP